MLKLNRNLEKPEQNLALNIVDFAKYHNYKNIFQCYTEGMITYYEDKLPNYIN